LTKEEPTSILLVIKLGLRGGSQLVGQQVVIVFNGFS
jgi:hypothetical protein